MSITIRNLKRSPTGRESIRERDFESDGITFGRDAACDVTLTDLSVALEHGRLSHDGAGDVYLDTAADQTVVLNNRIKSGRLGPLKVGYVLKLGVYQITIEAPNDDKVIIALLEETQVDEVATKPVLQEKHVFGLGRALPSKRLMSWVFLLMILGVFLVLPMHVSKQPDGKIADAVPFQTDLAWNSGPVSVMHSNLMNDCAACHEAPWEAVPDSACIDCHEDTGDHALSNQMRQAQSDPSQFEAHLQDISTTFGRPINRCGSCHVEHNKRAHIMPDNQETCGDCHDGLNKNLPDTKLLNVSDFGNDHPQFRPTIITAPSELSPTTRRVSLDDDPKGFSGLKFPHDIHMSGSGGVPRMAKQLDSRYAFSNGVDCEDCHRQEAGGALYEPVNMTNDCAMCHSIVFEDDDGYPRTLRHGEPDEVIASMRDFYDAKALGNIRDAEMNTRTRRRPGRAASLRALNRREMAFKQSEQRTIAKVDAIFSEGGACYDCHVIDRPDDIANLDFRVRSISVSDAFYPASPFNHAVHEIGDLTCESCHAAKTSKTSNDILLPKIAICRDCHIGEDSFRAGGAFTKGKFPTNCLTCHSYHNDKHVNMTTENAAEISNPNVGGNLK